MKRSSNYFLVILIVFFIPGVVFAHPGRTDASGCHTCRTNCAKWGLSNGEYHCHNGNSSSSSSSSYNNSSGIYNTQPVVVEDVKSSDTSINSIKVDGELVELTKMEYKTNAKMVVIEIILNDSKATYEIDDESIIIRIFDKDTIEKQGRKQLKVSKGTFEIKPKRKIKLFN